MERNCETCKHWYTGSGWAENRGGCDMTDSTLGVPDKPESLAYTIGCDSVVTTLSTHATHWCSQWEGKV